MRHLLGLGHRRILHLPGPAGWAEAEERQRGFEAIMRERRLPVLVAPKGDWTVDVGREIALEVLRSGRDRPTAIFAVNDDTAIGVLAAAHDLGLRVPEDLSVVGFDDVPYAKHFRPALTTVRQDFEELGRRAIAALLDEIEGTARPVPHPRVLPHLVVRDSTAEVTIRERPARPA